MIPLNKTERSYTQLDSRKEVIVVYNEYKLGSKKAQKLKRGKQIVDKSSETLKISTKSMC